MKRLEPRTALTRAARVSVVIPCYNYAAYLGQCLTSVLTQPGVELEVVVIDDASTDASVDIVEQFTKADERVRLVRHRTNRGHIETFNECLRAGRGELIVKLDADDLLSPGQLIRSVALMQTAPSVGFVYGRAVAFSDKRPTSFRNDVRNWTIWPGREWIARICARGNNVILQPEVLMRRSVLEEVGGHHPALPASSDFSLWLRMAAVSDVGRINGPDQGLYRVHNSSMQRTIHSGVINDVRAREEAFRQFFEEDSGKFLPDATQLQLTALRSIALESVRLASDAYDFGRHNAEPVAEYMDLACRADANVVHTGAWRALQRRRSRTTDRTTFRHAGRRVGRDLQGRARWRLWQWRGM